MRPPSFWLDPNHWYFQRTVGFAALAVPRTSPFRLLAESDQLLLLGEFSPPHRAPFSRSEQHSRHYTRRVSRRGWEIRR